MFTIYFILSKQQLTNEGITIPQNTLGLYLLGSAVFFKCFHVLNTSRFLFSNCHLLRAKSIISEYSSVIISQGWSLNDVHGFLSMCVCVCVCVLKLQRTTMKGFSFTCDATDWTQIWNHGFNTFIALGCPFYHSKQVHNVGHLIHLVTT